MYMKICSVISFRGVKPEYSENGYTIKPIYKDYKPSELQALVDRIPYAKLLGEGKNGCGYALDKDLVIKKAKDDAYTQESIMIEAEKLDMFYQMERDTKLDLQNSQKGLAAFKTPNGDSYLLSTRVPGENAQYGKNPLNKKNLSSMIKIIITLDKGIKNKLRIMPYDFNGHNINFTKNKAGLYDFEYMQYEDIKFFLHSLKDCPNFWSISSHISDTSPLNSSLRSFEYNCFLSYLNSMPEDEANELFRQYLKLKSDYHKKMSKYYKKLSKVHEDSSREFMELSKKEKNHAKLLGKRKIDTDILKAEAMKIQMASFLSKLYDAMNDFGQLPYKQLGEYYKNFLCYIQKSLRNAIHIKDKAKARYFCDCKTIMHTWRIAPYASGVYVKNSHKTNTYVKKTLDLIVK